MPRRYKRDTTVRRARIIAVGKLKTPHWQAAAEHYAARLARGVRIDERVVRDADAALSTAERKEQEAERLLKLLTPKDCPICLDEYGTMHDSKAFAELTGRIQDAGRVPCFFIGGAYGLGDSILAAAEHRVSLGAMTFPHELARVILYEQLYRAEQIRAGTGYHHE